MNPRRFASVAALVGGIAWLVKVALVWAGGGENDAGLVGAVFVLGLAGVVVALAAAGYALVATAPGWLRAVVTVATPLLVLMVWQLLDQAVRAVYTTDTWLRGELGIVLAAVVALVLGAWGLRRQRPVGDPADSTGPAAEEPPARPVRGRRAAR